VKLVKAAIVVFGALGIATLLWMHVTARWQHDALNVILSFVGFGLPALLAAAAIAKPPMVNWQATACVAGFGYLVVRTRAWESFGAAKEPRVACLLVAMLGGLAASLYLLLKPER
jgi:hypothetical protein